MYVNVRARIWGGVDHTYFWTNRSYS